ncbi:MAG: M23 family metallopeptidase [Chthoniobacterales bacterium]|nr:M23 family metallopeptidase [Chthoniobacterales bacterium]
MRGRLWAGLLSAGLALRAAAFTPVLPTPNDAIFNGRPQDFYMYVDRDFEGQKSKPWQGGGYGFTREPQRIGGKIVTIKFHEGIDIRPLRRDAAGEPLDPVVAVEDGRVVHTSTAARDSNYGKYIVIEHRVDDAPVYTIYAHLESIDVLGGQSVRQGTRLGRMGHTGDGINRERAHVHLEIAILWNDGFESWHQANFPTPNKHGVYNGINLMGLDTAALYLAQKKDPSLTLPGFIRTREPYFRVRIPASPHFQLVRRYPWLAKGNRESAGSWLVSFTAAGFPIAAEALPEEVAQPRVEWVKPSDIPPAKATRSLLAGSADCPRFGPAGEKLMQLILWDPSAAHPPEKGL